MHSKYVVKGHLFEGMLLDYLFYIAKKAKISSKDLCSIILSLYQKVRPFYSQKFYTDQSQVIGLFTYVEEVIFLTSIWLSHGQLWVIIEGTADVNHCVLTISTRRSPRAS